MKHESGAGGSSASRIWPRGDQKFFPTFCQCSEAKWSEWATWAVYYWLGGWALEALAFLVIKYAFSHFSWYFFLNFLLYIYVDMLQNIYFNMKDSGHFWQMQFPFSLSEKMKGFSCLFGLVWRYINSISQGCRARLGPQKLLYFQLSNMHSPTFPGTFLPKN